MCRGDHGESEWVGHPRAVCPALGDEREHRLDQRLEIECRAHLAHEAGVGPGFVAGMGNGVILGYLMDRSGLVPRRMAMLGLVGGPLVCASGLAVVLNVIGRGSAAQGIATIPEFAWELSLGIWLTVKGFKSSPITTDKTGVVVPDESSQPAIAMPPKPAVAVR